MRRLTFNLNSFLVDLNSALVENPQNIDYEIQRYKDFLSHSKEPIRDSAMTYVDKHVLVTGNQEVRSYIEVCHRLEF